MNPMSYDSMMRHTAARQGLPQTGATVRCEGCDELTDLDRTEKLSAGGRACRECCAQCDACGRITLNRDLYRSECVSCVEAFLDDAGDNPDMAEDCCRIAAWLTNRKEAAREAAFYAKRG